MHHLRYVLVSLLVVACLFAPNTFGATTTTSIESRNPDLQQKIQERKALREERKADRVAKREEMKISLKEEARSRIRNRIALFESNSEAIWKGLEAQDTRLSEVIAKLKLRGVDTAESESLLEEARATLKEAKTVVSQAVQTATDALDEDIVSRNNIVGALESGQDIRKEAREAYKAVLTSLKNLKK